MRTLSFFLGILILSACVAVPLPALDANAPFSAHMLRHTSLLLVAAPLLAMAIPPANFARKTLTGLSRLTARLPLAAWLAGTLVMWAWHVPAWYNATARHGAGMLSSAPLLHDLSMLLAGLVFCWPLVTPYPAFRLPPLRAILYLATACVCCSLLGLLITFAPPGTYRGIGRTDQQTGGLIMWVPCCFVYMTASVGLLIRWLSHHETVLSFPFKTTRP